MPSNVPTAFSDLLAACTRSAVHLEMRDCYAVDYEKGPFADWRAGHRRDPVDRTSWWRPWLDLVQETVNRGVVIRRARIVSEPVSEYTRFLYDGTFTNVAAGEAVRPAQLGHLLTAGALPQVFLGIIPSAARDRSNWPRETFHVYDDKLVSVELVSAQVRITQPSEIDLYLKAFEQLRGMAVYGAEARVLILRAIAVLDGS
ncbi:DUF6879 family protein [Streptomyces sp. P17]|uniref:DUF6879 family protein n=1 Tax=Streptomyces sp. P17 TaxID=3074716 RepID=UPI0028F44D39|nr:DUF6879 family protein [Streptomyces sp. P17]MDT9700788.1 Scr1 family TA system antitoxin-like transcriptional regulator [Streptomyces sp. P17]